MPKDSQGDQGDPLPCPWEQIGTACSTTQGWVWGEVRVQRMDLVLLAHTTEKQGGKEHLTCNHHHRPFSGTDDSGQKGKMTTQQK